MFKSLEIFQLASGMAKHAGARQALVAQNVANADTPKYKSKDIGSFQNALDASGQTPLKTTKAGHIAASNSGGGARSVFETSGPMSPNGNTVSVESELLRSIEAEREQSRALAIYQSASTILKASIGRRR